jgi:glycosyltransferase involved in cell wall biosynthesis
VGIERAGVLGEILVADNGSEDNSVSIAEKLGVRVVHVKKRGYGNALRAGIQAASGKWIVMGDADESYDFSETDCFVRKFHEGFELVIGCRLPKGGRESYARCDAIFTPLARKFALFANGTAYVLRAYSRC